MGYMGWDMGWDMGWEPPWAGRWQSVVGRDFSQPVVGAVFQLDLHCRLSMRLGSVFFFFSFFISLSAFPFTIREAGGVGCRWGTSGKLHICATTPQPVTISGRRNVCGSDRLGGTDCVCCCLRLLKMTVLP